MNETHMSVFTITQNDRLREIVMHTSPAMRSWLRAVFMRGPKWVLSQIQAREIYWLPKGKLALNGLTDPFGFTVERISMPRSSWQVVMSRSLSTGEFAVYTYSWKEGIIWKHSIVDPGYSRDIADCCFSARVNQMTSQLGKQIIDNDLMPENLQTGYLPTGELVYRDEAIRAQGFDPSEIDTMPCSPPEDEDVAF